MTVDRFIVLSFIHWLLLFILKLFYFNSLFGSQLFADIVFLVLTAAVAAAVVRRFGHISFLEVIFCSIMWVGGDLLLDLLVTSNFTGAGMFKFWQLWVSYAVLFLALIFFHKKRHIYIRREQAAHHGHH